MNLVAFTDEAWTIYYERIMYDAKTIRQQSDDEQTGVTKFNTFSFGFPTAIQLADSTILATHWCRRDDTFGIRWTKLQANW